ncbi:PilZ domain-containing protein [bacterium]|nr:PilZ domain-containing protein [bacterium]
MIQRRKFTRLDVDIPIKCKIRNHRNELVISSSGKVANLCLGGMHISLPFRLIKITARLIDYDLNLPNPFSEINGHGIIRWGYWDEENWQTHLGLELLPMETSPSEELENLLIELAGDRQALYMNTLTN